MANIANPRKQFNFTIQTPGLNAFLAQKVTVPEHEIEIVLHGDTNYDIKTGGRHKYGLILIDKISSATIADNYIWNWMQEVQDPFLGGGFLPSLYWRTVEITQFSTDGVIVLNRWRCYECWPSKVNGIELNRLGSDNTMESVELCTNQVKHL